MPACPREAVLCRYAYDPLDRQTDCMPLSLPAILRFYCKSRLATEIQGALQTSVFQHDDQLLAQRRQQDGKVDTMLLVSDQQRSVLGARGLTGSHLLAYTPYGHRPAENGLLSLLGFNGERPDPVTGHFHLGNGYRQFNPVLMRFNSPDSWSPFGEGGLNPYAYCGGDPRNWVDSAGHVRFPAITQALARFRKSKPAISDTSKSISKLPATGSNPATSSRSSPNRARKPESMNKHSIQNRAYRKDLKELSSIIEKNEATLPTQNKYNTSDNITDISTSRQGYEIAKKNYGFERYPDPDVQHIWTDPNGAELLDVAHFDIVKSHFINLSKRSNNKSSTRDYNPVYHVAILRAAYIEKFTNIDLMRIRQ